MARLNRLLALSFIDKNPYVPGNLYLLDIDNLEYPDYTIYNPQNEKIILSIVEFIQAKHTIHRIVFTYMLESIQVLSGVHWVQAAKLLGIKKIRGWYVDTDTFIYGDDFILENDELISLEPCETT
jgi:ParB-like chromosome segregation protein Spo0J